MPNEPAAAAPPRRWLQPMTGREPDEPHRTSTPLELFFDLTFVVAVAFAAAGLHHALVEDHVREGLLDYLFVFFGIWWAWVNFTWFSSAYDCDDVPYRITTMVQLAGALILAAGVPEAIESDDFTVPVAGYVVMRLALVTQWLRVAFSDAPHRGMALRYAVGIAFMQMIWVLRLATSGDAANWTLIAGVAGELLVPVWAEQGARSPWHIEHIIERYGLFTIIMLGESILAGTIAFQAALDVGGKDYELIALAFAGLLIVFSMWWLYFNFPEHRFLTNAREAFFWGYGHYFIFASAAAVGAGIEVAVDFELDHSALSLRATGLTVGVPVAVYLIGVWELHRMRHLRGVLNVAFPACALLVLGAALTPYPVHVIAAMMVALVALVVVQQEVLEEGARSHEAEATDH